MFGRRRGPASKKPMLEGQNLKNKKQKTPHKQKHIPHCRILRVSFRACLFSRVNVHLPLCGERSDRREYADAAGRAPTPGAGTLHEKTVLSRNFQSDVKMWETRWGVHQRFREMALLEKSSMSGPPGNVHQKVEHFLGAEERSSSSCRKTSTRELGSGTQELFPSFSRSRFQ